MKTIFYTITFLFSFSLPGHAQITYHFPHSNAVWGRFEGVYFDLPFGNDYYSGASQFCAASGDTSFNGHSYIKIYEADSSGTIYNVPPKLIREEQDRVYYFWPLENTDTLLYDFSLQAGDTAHVFNPQQLGGIVTVDSVGQLQIGNQLRKCIYLNYVSGEAVFNQTNYFQADYNPVKWIEGIGSNDGLFYPYGGAVVVDGITFLTCFRENDTLKYGSICNLIYTETREPMASETSEVFPNPSSGKFTVSIADNVQIPFTISVKNIFGQTVMEKQDLKSHEIGFDLSGVADGNYLMEIRSDRSMLVKKILVRK